MVIKDNIEKVITRGISIIYTTLKTIINKLLAVTVHDQLTANLLANTLSTNEILFTNVLSDKLKRLTLFFYK
jgi:hypothetical protein